MKLLLALAIVYGGVITIAALLVVNGHWICGALLTLALLAATKVGSTE